MENTYPTDDEFTAYMGIKPKEIANKVTRERVRTDITRLLQKTDRRSRRMRRMDETLEGR